MKTFQDTIKAYLDKRATEDSLFAVTYAKENKNIDECCTYITDRAEKEFGAGGHFVEPDIVFGWAVHYYDEDDIKVKDTSSMRMPVNNATIKQTDDKKETPKTKIKSKKKVDANQLSMF